jgi:hypothetical protein
MATSVQRFAATIGAGTAAAAPATVTLAVMPGVIDAIRWRVPPGPRGNLGWQLAMGGVNVIPENTGTFIIADDEQDVFAVSGLPDSGAWQVIGYNTGTFDHTVYLDFHVTPTAAANAQQGDITTGFPQSEADIPGMWIV